MPTTTSAHEPGETAVSTKSYVRRVAAPSCDRRQTHLADGDLMLPVKPSAVERAHVFGRLREWIVSRDVSSFCTKLNIPLHKTILYNVRYVVPCGKPRRISLCGNSLGYLLFEIEEKEAGQ